MHRDQPPPNQAPHPASESRSPRPHGLAMYYVLAAGFAAVIIIMALAS